MAASIWKNYHVPCNQYFPAYIIFSEMWKDLHRHIVFLSPDYGLLSAFLYGSVSKRNPLRATVQSFSFGQLNLKQGKRIQVADWHLEAPSLVLKNPNCAQVYQHVALWSELLLYSHGLGQRNLAQLFAELRSLLSSVLHFDSPAYCRLASLRFLWQFLLLEGFQPGLGHCHNCNQNFDLFGKTVFFSMRSELLCEFCARARNGHRLSKDEINVLCWAEQGLDSFVRQDELFFGVQTQYYSEVVSKIIIKLQYSLELLLGCKLQSIA